MPKSRKDTPPSALSSNPLSSANTSPMTKQTKLDDLIKQNSPKKDNTNEEDQKTPKATPQNAAAATFPQTEIPTDPALIQGDTQPYDSSPTNPNNLTGERAEPTPTGKTAATDAKTIDPSFIGGTNTTNEQSAPAF